MLTPAEKAAGAFIGRMVERYYDRLTSRTTIRDYLNSKERAEMHQLAREVQNARLY